MNIIKKQILLLISKKIHYILLNYGNLFMYYLMVQEKHIHITCLDMTFKEYITKYNIKSDISVLKCSGESLTDLKLF